MAELVRRARCATSACRRPSPTTIRRAHAVHPITALQTEYSLWSATSRTRCCRRCRELGHRLRRLQPARRGVPHRAGHALDDLDRRTTSAAANPRFQGEQLRAQPRAGRARSQALAEREGRARPAQLALAWVLAQGDDIVPIPGTKRRELPRGERRRDGDRPRAGGHRAVSTRSFRAAPPRASGCWTTRGSTSEPGVPWRTRGEPAVPPGVATRSQGTCSRYPCRVPAASSTSTSSTAATAGR